MYDNDERCTDRVNKRSSVLGIIFTKSERKHRFCTLRYRFDTEQVQLNVSAWPNRVPSLPCLDPLQR